MPYRTLAFAIHKKCTASCKHCCFECNPNSPEKLNVERVKEYINESKVEATVPKGIGCLNFLL